MGFEVLSNPKQSGILGFSKTSRLQREQSRDGMDLAHMCGLCFSALFSGTAASGVYSLSLTYSWGLGKLHKALQVQQLRAHSQAGSHIKRWNRGKQRQTGAQAVPKSVAVGTQRRLVRETSGLLL